MSNLTTLIARTCAIVGATLSLAAHAGDITPESLALMAAPWGGAKKVLLDSKAEQAAKPAVKTAASEPYDYDPPAGGWHVPGTPVRPAKISVAAR
ncbi:MAG: hypothetical protein JNM33_07365 [Rubrivivax sp.]|nr:hypothetical protein [Rubrivivax sp.]